MGTTIANTTGRIPQEDDGTSTVLIVESDPEAARMILEILARKGIRGCLAKDAKAALDFLDKNNCDLVFACDRVPKRTGQGRISGTGCAAAQEAAGAGCDPHSLENGFELLRKIKANQPDLPVIMMGNPFLQTCANEEQEHRSRGSRVASRAETSAGDTEYAVLRQQTRAVVEAVRRGCCDFLVKPLVRESVETLLDTLLPGHSVSTSACAQENTRYLYRIVGKSASMVQTVDLAEKIAPTSAPVLIIGESGAGKELFSYLVHHKSGRAQGPYIKVNCAALSDSLLESELFGHEKGAFTGAHAQRRGRIEAAHGGTLLLDEITETPARFQAKLLRVLEQQDFERVGGNENVRVDIRIISTTNKNIAREVQAGRFRQDLYYRLSGIRLIIPPLRERAEDLADLVWHFVNLYAREARRRITRFDPVMLDIFAEYHWPGNIRQLRNVVRTALILGTGETLSLADASWLLDGVMPRNSSTGCDAEELGVGLETTEVGSLRNMRTENLGKELSAVSERPVFGGVRLEQIERRAILDTLRQTAGNQAKAARVLGISDRTLRDKMRRYRQQGCLQAAR